MRQNKEGEGRNQQSKEKEKKKLILSLQRDSKKRSSRGDGNKPPQKRDCRSMEKEWGFRGGKEKGVRGQVKGR